MSYKNLQKSGGLQKKWRTFPHVMTFLRFVGKQSGLSSSRHHCRRRAPPPEISMKHDRQQGLGRSKGVLNICRAAIAGSPCWRRLWRSRVFLKFVNRVIFANSAKTLVWCHPPYNLTSCIPSTRIFPVLIKSCRDSGRLEHTR